MTEDMHLHLEGRYSHLDGRVASLDSRVNEMSTDIASIKTGQESIVKSVQILLDRASTPSTTNWVAVASLILAIMVGGGGYVQLVVDPMKSNIRELQAKDQANDDLHAAAAAALSRLETQAAERLRGQKDMVLAQVRLREIIASNLLKTGELESQVEALNDNIERVDLYGSRRWATSPKGPE